VKESAVADAPAAVPDRRGRMFASSRLVLEFALLFIGTMAAKELLGITGAVSYPNLLWLPVAVLTLQNGLGSALAAAIIASGLQYVSGLPPELLGEDVYSYIARIAAEPIAWTGFALIFGHIRSRQIAHAAELQAQLAERTEQCAAVAELCDDLRRRLEALERQIAAAGQLTDADVAQATIELHQAGWDVPPPAGTMFAWAPIPAEFRGLGSLAFSKLLLERANVAVSPGAGFGEYGEGFVRIALVENRQRLRQASRNIKAFLAGRNDTPELRRAAARAAAAAQ